MSSLRFSIVITCYNQRDFIRAAVDSALSQPFPGKEIVVVDDASTDGSAQILQEYGEAIRLACLEKNCGALEARNYGISLAKGEYIVYLDGDDVLMPWAIDIYDRIITERKPAMILGQVLWFKGAVVPPVAEEDVPRTIEFVEYEAVLKKDRSVRLSASSLVVDRQASIDVGGWTPDIFQNDIPDMVIKLGYSGRTILICSPMTAFYRIHPGNSIHATISFVRTAHRLIAKEKSGEYPGGPEHQFERYAWLGGVIFFWTKRALQAGLYIEALKLAGDGWLMIAAGIISKCRVRIKGRRPVETIEITKTTDTNTKSSGNGSLVTVDR